MRNWLFYAPRGARQTMEDAEAFVTVREGFSKAAFFLAPFWLAARRCWLALAMWLAAMAAAVAIVAVADVRGAGAVILLLLPNAAIGLENAWVRARSLERRGYTLAGAVMARSRDEAEVLFFHDWLTERPAEAPAPAPASAAAYRPANGGVLGLFPQPGGAR